MREHEPPADYVKVFAPEARKIPSVFPWQFFVIVGSTTTFIGEHSLSLVFSYSCPILKYAIPEIQTLS